ncbi:hypothetical protein PIB30_047990 [Stylosanthes scabra]|uniref:Ubiquitin-like protease family profile domain-containing protein n=1 Tax=Stylosanthes scabra TaxID=79078 RepID=A0ABU6THJ6_9FABA|nr:hypothetical protein [Stylosanthes scabra]
MEPKMSQDKDATPTPSQEDLLTPATLVALEKLHEETAKKLLSKQTETEKKQLYIQAEAKMSDILRMRAAIQAIDNFDNLDTTAQDAENEEPKTPRKRLYKWATEGEGDIMYKFLFRFIIDKPYVAIMHIMCILHNKKNNERFQDMIYCVPPYFMYHLLQKVHHEYFDPETNRPFALSILLENDGLEYDCGVHVLKYLEVVNPIELNKKSYKVPALSQEQFDEYRQEIVERILLDNDNFYRVEAVQATVPTHRQSRPSCHLQSPYVQLNSSDIESGKSKDK